MTNKQIARLHAALRIRLRLRQRDVAEAAGIGRETIIKLEAAEIDGLRVREVRGAFEAMGARLELIASYRGAELERLVDEAHAALVAAVIDVLERLGWVVRVEVTFSVRGERGSIDVLAWHPIESALLVVEVKSEIPGVERLLRPLDTKVRLARRVAHEQFGWQSKTVSRVVVLPEESTARRQVERHVRVINQALPARSRAVRRWLRRPVGAIGGVWFLSPVARRDLARNPSAIRRVQRPRSRTSRAPSDPDRADLRLIDPHRVATGDG